MKKNTYIKPESTVIEPLCKDEIMDGLHGASFDIDGKGGGHGSSQEGIPDKWWDDKDYDNETTTPTSIFDY
ncbi:MAG: hypothetical protein MRZ50_00705 [Prevotella sp.]|nr:hypothetical protein [Prevotella sp.]